MPAFDLTHVMRTALEDVMTKVPVNFRPPGHESTSRRAYFQNRCSRCRGSRSRGSDAGDSIVLHVTPSFSASAVAAGEGGSIVAGIAMQASRFVRTR
jgi:hypothetical protein